MKPPTKIAIIGCGGITCALAPNLALDYSLVLVDGDKFEADNSTRQFPAMRHFALEVNKAEYMRTFLSTNFEGSPHEYAAIPTYLEGMTILNNPEFAEVDFIFCAVDNNESRLLACRVAEAKFIPAILMGNETDNADAHLFLPGKYDPFDHHDFGPMTRAPFSCTADDNPKGEQTSRANFMAAACGLHILSSYLRCEDIRHMVVQSSMDVRADSSRKRYSDFSEP